MKRKLFLAVIAVLVLCLTCGMLLVACNDDKPNPDDGIDTPVVPPEEELSAADALVKIVQNLDEVATDTTGNKEFNFGIEIVDKGNGGNVIFGLATEKYDEKDYLYGAINGPYKKFNGFDLGATVQKILGWFGENIEIPIGALLGGSDQTLILDAENVINLSSTLAGMVLTKNVKAQNDSYMIELDLAKVVGLINTATSSSGGLDGLVAPYADIINTVIGAVKEAVLGADAATPASLSEFLNAVAAKYQVLVYFGFDGAADADKETDASDPFGGLMRGVLAARETEAKNLLNFTLDGTTELKDAEGAVTGRYDIDVDIDIDIFPLLGLLDFVTSNENLADLKIGFNVDDPAKIVEMVKQMGGISVEVNELNLDAEGTFKKNIITLYSDFASGEAIVQIYGERIVIYDVALGGVYDFDAIASYIMNAFAGAEEQPEEPAAESTALDLGGIDIMGLLNKILALTNLDTSDIAGSLENISANGFNIKMSGLMDVVDTIIDVDSDIAMGMTLRDLLPALWKSADTMNIKVESVGFGTATVRPVEEIAAVKYDSTPSALISEVTDIGVQEVLYGSLATGIDTMYTMKGTSMLTGEEVEFKGYILGFEGAGIDFSKPGKQTVTAYIAAENSGDGLIGMLKDMLDLTGYPIFGLYAKEVTFDILTDDSTVESASLLDADGNVVETISHAYAPEAKAGMQAPFELLDKYVSGAGYVVRFQITYKGETFSFNMTKDEFNAGLKILDGNGQDITATALDASGDIILAAGNYQIQVTYGGWTATEPLAVSTIAIKPAAADQGAPVLGSQYNYGITVVETMPDGTEKTLTPSSMSYKIGSTTVNGLTGTFDAVGTPDGSNKFLVTLDKLTNSLGEHNVTVTVTSENGAIRVSSIKYVFGKVDTPKTGLTATARASFAFGESVDNQFTITVSGKKYTLHWTGSAWQAVYADGDKKGEVNSEINAIVELNWREKKNGDEVIFQATPVTLSAQGYITNNPVTNGKSNMQTVDWKVTVGDMSTTGSFSISPWYSNDAEKEVGDTHSITGSLNIYVDGTRRSAQIYWDAEAKKYDIRAYSYSGGVYTYYNHADFDKDVVLGYTVKDASNNDVTATVFDAEGKYAAAGEYTFTYTLTFGDVTYTFTSTATITAPAAEA